MQRFHFYRRQKLSTVYALRRAQVEMLGDTKSNDARPFAWAGFAVFGGYAGF
jgi:hypothetical protein